MKKILLRLAIVGVVAAAAIGATTAYFSDTQTSTGNIISAGTIAISVDDTRPWQGNYTDTLRDMKPGMTRDITFTVANTGTNPVVLRKQIGSFTLGSSLTEGYCTSVGGTWNGSACLNGTTDLSGVMNYSMVVGSTTTIPVAWNIKMADVKNLWMPLGTIPAGGSVTVTQSYHFDEATGNWAQGDTLTFNIALYAEQVGGPGPNTTTGVVLENKDTSWDMVLDQTWGLLTWDVAGNYNLKAFGLDTTKTYTLGYWNEAASTWTPINGPVTTTGQLTLSGNYPGFSTTNAKYWLRNVSDSDNTKTLWEGNLVNITP